MKKWQHEIFLDCLKPASKWDRSINWIYDTKGKVGKSMLCSHICAELGTIVLYISGLGSNENLVLKLISDMIECGAWKGRVLLIDMSRADEQNIILYKIVEKIKNGRWTNTEYHPKIVKLIFTCKIYVFANWKPKMECLSADRWKIKELNEDDEKWDDRYKYMTDEEVIGIGPVKVDDRIKKVDGEETGILERETDGMDEPGRLEEVGTTNFRMSSTRWMFTYKGHIDKKKYTQWIKAQIGSIKIKEIFIAHENGDSKNGYTHTHVIFSLDKAPNWKSQRKFDYEGIHPHMQKIKGSKVDWDKCVRYLGKEDPFNARLKTYGVIDFTSGISFEKKL